MKKGTIGVQMMMLKDKVKENGVYETMEHLSELGFKSVEVSQIDMTEENVSELKRACKELGMTIATLSCALEPMMPGMPGEYLDSGFDKIVRDAKELECNFLRIGILPLHSMADKDKVLDFVRRCDEHAKKLKEHNIDLYYHNHHIEFVKYDGKYLLDIIRDETKYMGFELDVHWIQRGGENPLTFLKKYEGRIKLLHLKDYRVVPVKLPEGDFDMGKFMAAFMNTIEFAEVGEGNLPMKEIIDLGLELGCEHFLIEQDDQYGRDPFDSLKISRDNLYNLGYKEWFAIN